LLWQRAVAASYPELQVCLAYEDPACDGFAGFAAYEAGRLVERHEPDALARRAIADALAEERAVATVLAPAVDEYVAHRLYRYPDGLRLAGVKQRWHEKTHRRGSSSARSCAEEA